MASRLAGLVRSAPRGANRERRSLSQIRERRPNAYNSWTTYEEHELKRLFYLGCSVKEIAGMLQRQAGGIRSRLRSLELGAWNRTSVRLLAAAVLPQ